MSRFSKLRKKNKIGNFLFNFGKFSKFCDFYDFENIELFCLKMVLKSELDLNSWKQHFVIEYEYNHMHHFLNKK